MSFEAMTFPEVLDDLQSRFIINVPDEELSSVERVCFQIEQAHWFYEDFVREQNPRLPSLSLKRFSATFFNHCEFLSTSFSALDHEEAFENFMSYKVRVPVCGAIILNEGLKKILLVRGWKSNAGWGFPKGKINKDEPEITCAIREVYEEIGFDIGDRVKAEQYVERTLKDQKIRLYIITDVPETTKFKPQTRKEIGGIEWISLELLPGWTDHTPVQRGKYYMVVPFIQGIKSREKRDGCGFRD
ncbi:Dcp2, box A domain-containing protein [Cladochytrium replicatum]|nr:Dcp2, box A domain-containing protein [Cladochytrium replicatum]